MVGRRNPVSEGESREQLHRSLVASQREQASARRLEAVFKEEDAALAARLGEDIMAEPAYRFRCRF